MSNLPKNPTREEIAEILYAAVAAHVNIQHRRKYGNEDTKIVPWEEVKDIEMFGGFIYRAVDYVMVNPKAGPVNLYNQAMARGDKAFDDLTPDEAYLTFLIAAIVTSQMGWIEERPAGK